MRFRNEQRAGSLVVVESAIIKIGNKSMTLLHRMRNTESGEVAATSEVVGVHFDLKSRSSMAIPDEVRERMQAYLLDPAELPED